MSSTRIKRVSHLLRNEIGEILENEITDPRIGFVTVCHVEVSKDLRRAVVFVSILSDDSQVEAETLEALENARGYIKSLLSERIVLKFLPDLSFRIHRGASHAARIEAILRKLRDGEKKKEESE